MAIESPVQIPRERIAELIEREEKRLNDATMKSKETYERARVHLSGGVASSYQLRDPWPIYLERGAGPKVWDVDGNEMYDFHNGFGSMVQGHAHPAIGAAIALPMAGGAWPCTMEPKPLWKSHISLPSTSHTFGPAPRSR